MAKKEKFILLSLKEDESKKLAQVISNDTSRKILDYLADKEATESELAQKLGVPISTVHYNLQALVKAKMVEANEYHYSEKGKEVLHYKLANKYIIIAPKSTFGIKEKLKSILPVGLLAVGVSFVVYLYNQTKAMFGNAGASMLEQGVAAAPKAARIAQEDAALAMDSANVAIVPVRGSLFHAILAEPALWFLIGAVFTLVLIIVVEYIVYLRNKN